MFSSGVFAAAGQENSANNEQSGIRSILQQYADAGTDQKKKEQAVSGKEQQIRSAAENGDPVAQLLFAMMYENGKGVKKDEVKAAKWFRKSAEQGDGNAQVNLGRMYLEGAGLKQDVAEAVKWCRKSAEQGNTVGQYCLGVMYENGAGVKKAEAEAVKWYRKSAEQGNTDAQNRLGIISANGKNAPKAGEMRIMPINGNEEKISNLKKTKFPRIDYNKEMHGPKIKSFFIGMSFDEMDLSARELVGKYFLEPNNSLVKGQILGQRFVSLPNGSWIIYYGVYSTDKNALGMNVDIYGFIDVTLDSKGIVNSVGFNHAILDFAFKTNQTNTLTFVKACSDSFGCDFTGITQTQFNGNRLQQSISYKSDFPNGQRLIIEGQGPEGNAVVSSITIEKTAAIDEIKKGFE